MGGWSSPPSTGGGGSITPLYVGTNLVSQANSTNPQFFNLYGSSDNTGVPTTNYSRLKITHGGGSNGATLSTEAGGTGVAGPFKVTVNSNTWTFETTGRTTLPTGIFFTSSPYIEVGGSVALQIVGNSEFRVASSVLGFNSNTVGSAGDIALGRNAAGVLEVNNSTLGTYRDLIARNVRTSATTVASLTAAATAGAGARSFVTDATATTFGTTVAGGGSNAVPVYCDGTNWKIG